MAVITAERKSAMKDARIEKFNRTLNNQELIWGDYTPTGKELSHFTYIPEIKGWRIDWEDGKPLTIGTHSQGFHADDLAAVLLLKEEFCPEAKVVRSRDREVLASCDILTDIGEGLLDHHGKRANRDARIAAVKRVFWGIVNNFIQLSWDGSWIMENAAHEYGASRFLEVIEAVSAWDTGHSDVPNPFPWVHTWSQWAQLQGKDMDQEFLSAMARMKTEIEQMADLWGAEFKALKSAEETIKKGGEVISFSAAERLAPVKEMMYEAKSECVFFVSPETDDDWRILCAADPEKEFSGFSSRKLIPEKYRGLGGEELSRVTGIPGGIFVHQDGFIAGFKTREAAEKFANLCLGPKPQDVVPVEEMGPYSDGEEDYRWQDCGNGPIRVL